jgi:hypothetical protein
VDHDIRQMLRERADDLLVAPTLDFSTLRRARRRRSTTTVTAVLSIALLIAGGAVATSRLRNQGRPVEPTEPSVHSSLKLSLGTSRPSDVALAGRSVIVAADDALLRFDSDGRLLKRWTYPGDGYPRPAVHDGVNLAIDDNVAWVILNADGLKRTVTPAPQGTESCSPAPGGGTMCSFSAQAGPFGVGPKISGFKNWSAVYRVDLRTGRATLGPKDYVSEMRAISAGPAGVWIGSTPSGDSFDGKLTRIDRGNGRTISSMSVDGRPISIDATTKDFVAVLQTPGEEPNNVVRIDVARKRVTATRIIYGAQRVIVRKGQVWVSDNGDTRQASREIALVRLSLPTLVQTARIVLPKEIEHFGVTFTVSDTAVWVAAEFPEQLLWFDPSSAKLVKTTDPKVHASGLAADRTHIWLIEDVNGRPQLYRFDVGEVASAR